MVYDNDRNYKRHDVFEVWFSGKYMRAVSFEDVMAWLKTQNITRQEWLTLEMFE